MNKPRLGAVAVVPFWSQSDNMNTDSNYSYLRIVLPKLVEKTEATVFLLFFPDPKYGADRWVYKDDGLQSERIRFYPWNYDTAMNVSVTGFDTLRFKQLEYKQGPGIFWLHQVESGPFIYGGYAHTYNITAQPTMIAQHHYIIHRSLPYTYDTLFPRQWLQIGGSLASDLVVYNSDYTHHMAEEAFQEYLTAQKWVELEQKSRTLKFGLVRGDEPYAPAATEKDPPVFIYNHRFELYKQPEITFKLFDELRAEKYPIQVWASQTYGQHTKGLVYDRSVFAASRAEYLQNIAVPGINTINSIHETFCISILDSLAIGHLVVVPNRVTFPELVPPDYPFVFNSDREQGDMIRTILSRWPYDYNLWRERLQKHARENFSLDRYVDDYLALMQVEEERHWVANKKEHLVKGVQDIIKGMVKGKPYAARDLRDEMCRAIWGSVGSNQSFPTRRAIREALVYGGDEIDVIWQGGIHVVKR